MFHLNRERWREIKGNKAFAERFISNVIDVADATANLRATRHVTALCCLVLRDKYGFGGARLRRLLVGIKEQAEAVNSRRVSMADIIGTLQAEVPDISTFWGAIQAEDGVRSDGQTDESAD